MRKLLTMMAAVASALGLYATNSGDPGALSGTSFEGLHDGDLLNITDTTGEITGTGGFWRTNGTDTLTIKFGECIAPDSQYRSIAFRNVWDNEYYLNIKTETPTNPISRYVNVGGAATNINDGVDTGLYFDSFVRFTAFDGDDPPVNLGTNGKLAIWLKEEGEEGNLTTNLVITAGYLNNSEEGAVVTNYNCAVAGQINFNDGGWHRVTVKAIDSIYNNVGGTTPGFVVFVDRSYVYCTDTTTMGISGNLKGTASKWNSVKALFPSACQYGAGKDSIVAVDFAGQGDVDDLVFTRTAPFEDAEDVGLFRIELGEGVAKVTFTTNGVSEEITADKSFTLTDDLTTDGITITATYENGYVKGTWGGLTPYDGDLFKPDADGQYVQVVGKPAGATVNGVGYETLTDAIAAANSADSDCTVKLMANADTGITINNANSVNITLDLAGNTITAIAGQAAAIYVQAGNVIVTNSTGVGTVQGAVDNGVLGGAAKNFRDNSSSLTIQDGVYNGEVKVTAISGGSFLATYNDQVVNNKTYLDGKLVDGTSYEVTLSENYYVLTEKAQTYTIKFVYGENGATTNTQSVASGSMPTEPTAQEVAVEGKTFTGWDSTVVAAAADATYTAQYTVDSYTITFVYGLTGQSQYQQSYNYGLVPEIPGDAAITGYDLSWSPAIEAVKSNTTYTAEYTAVDYTITYMYGENELTGLTPATYTVADAVTLPTKVDLGVTGVAFEAWTNAEGTVVADWAAGAIGNKTFYAQVTVPGPAEKYEPGEEGITPPTGKTAAEFAAVINADKAKYIDTPSTSDVADTTAYLALFQAVADTEKGTVSIGLTTGAAAEAKDAADDTAADIVSDLTATTVTIDAEPGLWYSISVSSTLGGLATGEGTRVMATDSSLSEGKLTLNIPVIDDSTPARFYKVNVNLADKPVTP